MPKNNKKDRPRIHLEKQPIDIVLEGASILLLILMLIYCGIHFQNLPEKIPTHFNASGESDEFGGKTTIWLLPFTGLVQYVILTVLNRFPHTFNYPVKITAENAEQQYRLATRLILSLKASILLLFGYITFKTVSMAEGKSDTLGNYSMVAFVVLLAGITGFYFIQSFRARN
jgi:uncharacterized membrane protein